MRTRFISFLESPDASEGTNVNSKYSTERSPRTALLFEASHTVVLPLVRIVEEPARRRGYALSDPALAQDMVNVVAD